MKTYTATQQQLDQIFGQLNALTTQGCQNAELIVGIKIMLGEIVKAAIKSEADNVVDLPKKDSLPQVELRHAAAQP